MYQIAANSTPIRACIYCRISLARFGDTVKVDDQERICRDLAAARTWTVADHHVYKDNSLSAWRHDRKRPGWDAMLAAIERREIDAIIVYHGDRLIRQPWDLELLLRLAGERRVHLASPTGQRDLSNDDDQFILRIEAAAACREVASTSRRMKAMFDRQAAKGITRLGGRGGRAFGFEPDGLTVREADKEMIRDVAKRILRGEHVSAICRDLNTRGYRTTTGGEWVHGSLSKLMQRPRLAGLVAHHGRIVGPAAWPAILDRDTWEAVCAALSGKAKVLGFQPTNAGRYWLSGIATCGSCGHTVAARHNVRGRSLLGYGCINKTCSKKVHRAIHHVDPFVEGAVIELLADPRIRARMAPATAGHLVDELERLEARRARRVDEYATLAAVSDDDVAVDALRGAIAQIDARVVDLRAEIGKAAVCRTLDGLYGISLEEFRALPLARRRAAVKVLLRVTIVPTGRRGPTFDPLGVRLEPAY